MKVLEEICQLLSSVRDALLHDVHSVNTECQALLASIKAEQRAGSGRLDPPSWNDADDVGLDTHLSHRLDRVQESRLSDYDTLRHVPKAIVNDYTDMWQE